MIYIVKMPKLVMVVGAAVRFERETGQTVGGRLHTQKAENYIEGLEDWLIKNPNASTNDKMAAE